MKKEKLFFCGIGGSGMSALAMYCKHLGFEVCGSDRNYDQGKLPEYYQKIKSFGIELFPQDGSAINSDISKVIASSAVEDKIPDIKAAKEKNVTIQLRASLLAELFNKQKGIAVAGTSGKSTTTAMIAHILRALKQSPNVINGAIMLNATSDDGLGNTYFGDSDLCVIEADESDGSIQHYNPAIAVLNNISFDHKPLPELRALFSGFLSRAKLGAIINRDDAETYALKDMHPKTISFSIKNKDADLFAENIQQTGFTTSFKVHNTLVKMNIPGDHNVQNALAALCVVKLLDLDFSAACKALETFQGTKRRMQHIGTTKNNIIVIDDFAHNADKIKASLSTLQALNKPIHAMFQPHGFTPTLQQKDDLIEVFSTFLKEKDFLYIPEIYFAGGTVERKISSKDLTDAINKNNRHAFFFEKRDEIKQAIIDNASNDNIIIIMGARDDTLTDFAKEIFSGLK